MPSVKLALGKYVSVRPPLSKPPLKDGTRRVLFEVPARLRPSGWSPTIPLPIEQRSGDLSNADEVARIQADAKRLNEQLAAARLGRVLDPVRERCIDTLIRTWQGSQDYKDNKPVTNRGYECFVQEIRAWAATLSEDTDPVDMTEADVEAFLSIYDEERDRKTGEIIRAARPSMKYSVHKVLRMVMAQMKRLKWRNRHGEVADNPVNGVKVSQPKATISIWEPEDVSTYAWAACCRRRPSFAAMLLTNWEIGQRPTDLIRFRHGADFIAAEGIFRFWQEKTKSYVTVRISERCRAAIEAVRVKDSPYLFHDDATGRPWPSINRVGHVFESIREYAMKAGAPYLVFRVTRHSVAVQIGRAGGEVPELISVTGHSPKSADQILKTYLPRDSKSADNAQRKRGLIGAA